MKKAKTIFFFFLLILIPAVLGLSHLTELDFLIGNTWFNSQIPYTDEPAVINYPAQPPLIEDLDNDGINEIIILDGTTLKIFQNSTLDLIASTNLLGNHPYYSNIIVGG